MINPNDIATLKRICSRHDVLVSSIESIVKHVSSLQSEYVGTVVTMQRGQEELLVLTREEACVILLEHKVMLENELGVFSIKKLFIKGGL